LFHEISSIRVVLDPASVRDEVSGMEQKIGKHLFRIVRCISNRRNISYRY